MPQICATTDNPALEQTLIQRGFRWCKKDGRWELKTSATSSTYQFCLRMQAEGKLTLEDHDGNPIA